MKVVAFKRRKLGNNGSFDYYTEKKITEKDIQHLEEKAREQGIVKLNYEIVKRMSISDEEVAEVDIIKAEKLVLDVEVIKSIIMNIKVETKEEKKVKKRLINILSKGYKICLFKRV